MAEAVRMIGVCWSESYYVVTSLEAVISKLPVHWK